jgi:hypothetical protein
MFLRSKKKKNILSITNKFRINIYSLNYWEIINIYFILLYINYIILT